MYDHIGRFIRELNNGFLDLLAVDCHAVYFAQSTIATCTGVVLVVVTPTSSRMSFERFALCTILFRTSPDLPARNEGVDMFYSLDAEFLFINGSPYALQAFDISLGIPTLI
jgi:hypothetical protein